MKLRHLFFLRIFERWTLFKIDLSRMSLPELPADLVFEKIVSAAEQDEWKLILQCRGEHYLKSVNARLGAADQFAGFVIRRKSTREIIFSAWTRFKPFFDSKMKTEIRLSGQDAFFYDAFCIPAFRGQGLQQFMLRKRMEYCLDRGCRRGFTIVSARNRSSLSNIGELGFVRVKSRIRLNTKRMKNLLKKGSPRCTST